jgi:predicted CopG family antitoxin
MINPNIKKAKSHLAKLRQLVTKKRPRFPNMSEEEVIKAIRKAREELWDKKFASRS